MKISVITPYYEGNDYMTMYLDAMFKNRDNLFDADDELEVILVNDSPWKRLEVGKDSSASSFVKVITNSENKGIHYSRVAGLAEATGEYVMFLDQDDIISPNALQKLLKKAIATDADVVVANAGLEQADGEKLLWYRTDYHKSLVGDMKTYLRVGIQIISPGQCLIKKSAIPEFWCKNLVMKNGADDYYLWLLMLANKAKFSYYDEMLYIHKYTEKNLSADTRVTDDSIYDFLELLAECEYFNQKDIFTLHEMITFKNQFRASDKFGKITCALAHLPLFTTNIIFKIKTKTAYGFNRRS